jgi:hypothetical protein
VIRSGSSLSMSEQLVRQPRMVSEPTHCTNCGAPLHGHWCAQCGQPAIDYRRSLRHVIADVLNEFFNWDSKFFATIAWLIARPWYLTNEFLRGRRVRYLQPLRLYLLVSILFFFAVNYWAKPIHLNVRPLSTPERVEIEAALKNENLPADARSKIQQALRLNSASPAPAAQPSEKTSPGPTEQADQRNRPVVQFGPETPSSGFEKWVESRAREKLGEHGSNVELFLKALLSNLPYMMLCCIPLFALVLKVLYIRRGIFYVDHLVYALHIHSFAYAGAMLIGLATVGLSHATRNPIAGWAIGLLWLAFGAQIFLSIRKVYRQSWLVSTLKLVFGGFAYLVVLVVALAATFFITLAVPAS